MSEEPPNDLRTTVIGKPADTRGAWATTAGVGWARMDREKAQLIRKEMRDLARGENARIAKIRSPDPDVGFGRPHADVVANILREAGLDQQTEEVAWIRPPYWLEHIQLTELRGAARVVSAEGVRWEAYHSGVPDDALMTGTLWRGHLLELLLEHASQEEQRELIAELADAEPPRFIRVARTRPGAPVSPEALAKVLSSEDAELRERAVEIADRVGLEAPEAAPQLERETPPRPER